MESLVEDMLRKNMEFIFDKEAVTSKRKCSESLRKLVEELKMVTRSQLIDLGSSVHYGYGREITSSY